ncbi:WXG100 family type VII secretion target [Saccharomonospora azurea]|uniref:WXG100 family type VII secretion target n=1 Tax=Saccharomonospora azurea TaxID=40988 RepID=UPI003D8F2BC2
MSDIEDKETYRRGDLWHDPGDLITADNSRTNGLGIGNTIDVLQGAVAENDKVTMGIAGAGLALDTLGLVLDPLGTVFAAGIGWLIEHVTPFRVPLDLLYGDPEGITVATAALDTEKDQIEQWKRDLEAKLGDLMGTWKGEGAEAFRASTQDLADGMDALEDALAAASKNMQICGAVAGGVRGIIRDLIAAVLGGILAGALAAIAAMPFTFGTSIGIFLGTVFGTVAAALAKIATHISDLVSKVSSAAKALKNVGDSAKKLADDVARAVDDVLPTPSRGSNGNTGGGSAVSGSTGEAPTFGGGGGGPAGGAGGGGPVGGGGTAGGPGGGSWADDADPTFNPWKDEPSAGQRGAGGGETAGGPGGGSWADDPELTFNPWKDEPSAGQRGAGGGGETAGGPGGGSWADDPELTFNPWKDEPSAGQGGTGGGGNQGVPAGNQSPEGGGSPGGGGAGSATPDSPNGSITDRLGGDDRAPQDAPNTGGDTNAGGTVNTGGDRDPDGTEGNTGRDSDSSDGATGTDRSSENGDEGKSFVWDSKEKTRDLLLEGARKYADDHPEAGITPDQLRDFEVKTDKIINALESKYAFDALEKVNPEVAHKLEHILRSATDLTHGEAGLYTKGTLDFFRFGAWPAMVEAGVFPDEWQGENA